MSIMGIKYYESQKQAPIFYNLSNESKQDSQLKGEADGSLSDVGK